MDLSTYRLREQEKQRTADLLRLLPRGRTSVLDIGARDGHFSLLLTEYFPEVTALDLVKPSFTFPRVTTVAGDATKLQFQDNSFDCVFCAEVLEHIPNVAAACREIIRVAKYEIVIGVPFRQDIRLGRTTCSACGRTSPPWGHVNSFTEDSLRHLFHPLRVTATSFVGTNRERTDPLSTFLMDLAGNPWGTYDQQEPCVHCGAELKAPEKRALWQKVCSSTAVRLNRVHARLNRPHGNWIHMVFSKA